MKVFLKSCMATLLLAGPLPASAEPAVQAGDGMRFRCESDRSQPHYCSVDTSQGITLVKQLSGTPCMQGRNWDYDRHGVWVSHRCRAEFYAGKPEAAMRPPAASTIRCESRTNRIQHCPADMRKGARLARLLSASDCVENRDWGQDEKGIWTAHGCRAEFVLGVDEVAAGQTAGASGVSASRITCQSSEQRRQRCDIAVVQGVDLIRQLSKTRCVQGKNWDWDRGGIWVDQGCRAEFRVR